MNLTRLAEKSRFSSGRPFPQFCAAIFPNRPNSCYPYTFLYADEHDTIGRDSGHPETRSRRARSFNHGSAIKTSANSPEFNNMQFSNRRQTGGLAIIVAQLSHEVPLRRTNSRSSLVAHHSPVLRRPRAGEDHALIWLFPAPNATLFAPAERGKHAESAQMNPARIE